MASINVLGRPRSSPFHARYGDYKGIINIHTLQMIEGNLPRRALSLILDWAVVSVNPVNYLELEVKFLDGLEGRVKIKPSNLTGVFEPLSDPEYFKQVYVEHGVVTWPGELDLAPDAMYHKLKKR